MKNTTKSPLTLIMLGLQGSGKGTQAHILADKYGFKVIEAGALIRDGVKGKTLPAIDMKLTAEGKLIRISTIVALIEKEISKVAKKASLIIDGFPRDMVQNKELVKLLEKIERSENLLALHLKISKKTALDRALHRLMCVECGSILTSSDKKCNVCGGLELERRKDDQPELVKNRLKFVSKDLDAIKAYFRKAKKLVEINGELPQKAVTKEIIEKVSL